MRGNLRLHHQHRYEVPLLQAPVGFPKRPVPLDPYALGLLLGDGWLTGSTTPSFSTGDPELKEALAESSKGYR
jgi:phosphate starvation-inducible PhoH-like protein